MAATSPIHPSLYQSAHDSFKDASSQLSDTLDQIQSHLETVSKNLGESVNSRSYLQARLNQTETKLKMATDELAIQRTVRLDAIHMTERATALQKENAEMALKIAEMGQKQAETNGKLAKLQADFLTLNGEKAALQEAWKVKMRSYEALIDELRAQIPTHDQKAPIS